MQAPDDAIVDQARGGQELLSRIADTLGEPLDSFWQHSPRNSRLAETEELLQLWDALDTPEKRMRILSLAVRLVGQ